MADLPNDFWGGWIAVLTIASLLGLTKLVFGIFFTDKRSAEDDHQLPVWDENLREGSAAPPLWWFWLIFSALIFSLIYLLLYPGLGSFKGVLNWSQDSRFDNSYAQYETRFSQPRAAVIEASLASLREDPSLMKSAERVFARHCAACHDYDGTGQKGLFPNLKDTDWQWGGTPQQIEQSILQGRNAQMPPFKGILKTKEIEDVAQYVLSLSDKGASDPLPGKSKFDQACAACHGTDGKGNPLLGAPNLTDGTWLYGNLEKDIVLTITHGRNGEMPAFSARLDSVQIKLLTAWLSH